MPSTETTINGISESELDEDREPTDVIVRQFYSYTNNKHTYVPYYKIIGKFTHNNILGSSEDTMTANVIKSSSQGSDWTFSGSVSAKFKVDILAELQGSLGLSYKDSRSTNEAVGYSTSKKVPASKVGHLDLYYAGEKIGRVATYKQFYTANPNNIVYYKEDVLATVYDKDYIDIQSKGYDTK